MRSTLTDREWEVGCRFCREVRRHFSRCNCDYTISVVTSPSEISLVDSSIEAVAPPVVVSVSSPVTVASSPTLYLVSFVRKEKRWD